VFTFCLFLDNNGSIAILSNMSPFQQPNIAPSHSRITTEKKGFPHFFIEARRFQELNIFLSLQVIFADLVTVSFRGQIFCRVASKISLPGGGIQHFLKSGEIVGRRISIKMIQKVFAKLSREIFSDSDWRKIIFLQE